MAKVLLNGVTADGSSADVQVTGYAVLRVRVWSDVDATAVVTIEGKAESPPGFSASQPWFGLAAITDPTAAGDYLSIPMCGHIRATVSGYSVGKIYAILETWTNQNTKAII